MRLTRSNKKQKPFGVTAATRRLSNGVKVKTMIGTTFSQRKDGSIWYKGRTGRWSKYGSINRFNNDHKGTKFNEV